VLFIRQETKQNEHLPLGRPIFKDHDLYISRALIITLVPDIVARLFTRFLVSMTPTRQLYFDDTYQWTSQAQILNIISPITSNSKPSDKQSMVPVSEEVSIVLDQTLFYPQGGRHRISSDDVKFNESSFTLLIYLSIRIYISILDDISQVTSDRIMSTGGKEEN
jgi:hypothetical protein